MGKDLKGKELGKGLVQRKDGRYYFRQTYKGTEIVLYGYNYQDLKKKAAKAKVEIDNKLELETRYTVAEWFEEWFTIFKTPTIRPQSVAPMKRKVASTYMPYIGKIKLSELKSMDIQKATNALLEEGKYANGSISEALNRLRECFASAVNNRYMLTNPAFDLIVPMAEKDEKMARFLSAEEIPAVLDAVKDSWWYELVYVMIFTGLRVGEIGGLKTADIHWSENGKNGYIEVNQSLRTDYENGVKTESFGKLKTFNSHRHVPFLRDVETKLKNAIRKRDDLKKTLGDRYRGRGEFADLIFVTSMGSPCTRYVAEHTLKRLVTQMNDAEAKLAVRENREPHYTENIYPHALRHTFASLCYRAKLDPKVTQSLLGHANYSTTIDIYTHLSNKDTELDLSKFNEMNLSDSTNVNTDLGEIQI